MSETVLRERAREYPEIGGDPARIAQLFRDSRWHGLDDYWRPWHKLVEKSIRMVAGRHWDIYIDLLGRFVDITEFMTDEERAWRQRPVFNWIGYWYQITHAKLTENPPQVAFMPSSADRKDALMAETMDPIFKYLWDIVGMFDKHDLLTRWIVATGRGVTKSYWDATAGEAEPLVGPAQIVGPNGQPQYVEQAPYGRHPESGEIVPLVEAREDGALIQTGEPLILPKGELNVDILSPLEVRSSTEPVPQNEKRWWAQRGVMHVDEVAELFGLELEPDVHPSGTEDEIAQILFGLGSMGAAQASPRRPTSDEMSSATEGFVWTYECYERPRYDVPDMDNGRHTLVVGREGEHVVVDEPIQEGRDYRPYNVFDFIGLPGRPVGKTPVEDLTPIQQSYNRGWGQILEHRALMTNPIWIHIGPGELEISNQPGQVINVPFAGPGIKPLDAVSPPHLSSDVWETQALLLNTLQDLGSLREGSEGRAPGRDSSGQLIRELRFNDDRYVGPTAIRTASTYASMVQFGWIPLLQYGWDTERMITTSGENNRARFMLVEPEMFQGRVNTKPVPEALLPEGRDERQLRIERWYAEGLFGPPGDPGATATFFDLINYPHLNRAARPGGVDREMADWENAQMLKGVPVLPGETHDDALHLEAHREIEASPEWYRLPQEVRAIFEMHRKAHEIQLQNKALKMLVEAGAMQDAAGDIIPGQESPAQNAGDTE
jgi:hypothetical protein